jgi:hypothetical protein
MEMNAEFLIRAILRFYFCYILLMLLLLLMMCEWNCEMGVCLFGMAMVRR